MKLLAPRFTCKCGATLQHKIESEFSGTVKGPNLVELNVDAEVTCRKCGRVTIISGEIPVEQEKNEYI